MENQTKKPDNIIKVRDDREPLGFHWDAGENMFAAEDKQSLEWCSGTYFSKNDLRSRVESWLTSLFQSEHLSLLVGSGLTTAIQYAACDHSDNGMNDGSDFSVFADEIQNAAERSAVASGRKEANIEDRIRVGNDLIKGLDIIKGVDDYTDISAKLDNLRFDMEK